MNPYTLPLIKSLLRNDENTEIPYLESRLDDYVAPEGKLEAFRHLAHYPNNGYLPLTWPHIAAWRLHMGHLTHPSFPLRLPGIVQIGQSINQKRPIGSGEKLSLVCGVEKEPEHARGIAFALVNKVSIHGEVVWESRSTMLCRANPKHGELRHPSVVPSDGIGARNRIWTIPKRTALGYTMVSGDINPIHLSTVSAKLLGFSGVIIHGMWTLARVAGEHEDHLRQENLSLLCQFKRPIVLPSQVVYRFWPSPLDPSDLEFRVLDPKNQNTFLIGTIGTLKKI